MSLLKINRHPSAKDLRVFASLWLIFLSGFSVLAWAKASAWWSGLLIGGLVVGITGLIVPSAIRLVYLGAVYLTFPIGFVLSHLILGAVYYLLLTPIGLIMRLLGRDPLQRKFDGRRSSYWQPKDRQRSPADYFRQH